MNSSFVLTECLFTLSANSPPCWEGLFTLTPPTDVCNLLNNGPSGVGKVSSGDFYDTIDPSSNPPFAELVILPFLIIRLERHLFSIKLKIK